MIDSRKSNGGKKQGLVLPFYLTIALLLFYVTMFAMIQISHLLDLHNNKNTNCSSKQLFIIASRSDQYVSALPKTQHPDDHHHHHYPSSDNGFELVVQQQQKESVEEVHSLQQEEEEGKQRKEEEESVHSLQQEEEEGKQRKEEEESIEEESVHSLQQEEEEGKQRKEEEESIEEESVRSLQQEKEEGKQRKEEEESIEEESVHSLQQEEEGGKQRKEEEESIEEESVHSLQQEEGGGKQRKEEEESIEEESIDEDGKTSEASTTFSQRVDRFLNNKKKNNNSKSWCESNFFMTWISPSSSFGPREMIALESLFKSNPHGCLVILSDTMDSPSGHQILKPITELGYRILPISPDYNSLFNQTTPTVLRWYRGLQSGHTDPGQIPFAQNLSNLLRLVALYKYGGIYLDTDFVVLKSFSGLRNSIGAQSTDVATGKWTRLNNAALIFDKGHPLLLSFIEEFVANFDGSKWGHNGPYLVSRVIAHLQNNNKKMRSSSSSSTLLDDDHHLGITVLPQRAFYPVDWIKIPGLFSTPKNDKDRRWAKAKLAQLTQDSYGVHLWNRQTRRLRIEQGSIMDRLISHHCIICKHTVLLS